MIFRFALPKKINKNQLEQIESLNIKYIYDLRSIEETVKTGTISLEHILTRNIKIMDL